ncbi:hypothetical protein [Streptomyces sp. NPDC093071]|uniref:hypothetical protein n=1 Tax=Streptomyces sp. NPDC093071 TaxID=3366022 RepID=UPI00381D620F
MKHVPVGTTEPYGGATGFRFKIRDVRIDGRGPVAHVATGGTCTLGFSLLHHRAECGDAVDQAVVGPAGEDRAQASVWNGKRHSGGSPRVVTPGTGGEALAEDDPGPAEWADVSCDIVVPNDSGTYSVCALRPGVPGSADDR